MKRNEKQGSTSQKDNDWMYKNLMKYYDKIRNEEVEIGEASSDTTDMYALMVKGLKAMPGSPKQKEIIKQINVIRKRIGMPLMKEGYEEGTKEYLDYCMDLTPGEKVGEARTGDAEDEFQKAMAKFIKDGGKIKKLKDTKSFKSLFKQKGAKKLPIQAEETEKVQITEGRPAIKDKDAARPGDTEKRKRLEAQQKKYKPEEVINFARKRKVKIDPDTLQGQGNGDWDIDVQGGIKLDYNYKYNEMIITGWKADKKKIRAHINKYEQGDSSYEDLVYGRPAGRVVVGGFEAAFDLIGEEFQLTEEFWAVIDKAKGGEVMAVSSDEKGAKSSVKNSNFSKHDYHFGKDPRTLKIVSVMGKHSQKKAEKMIGTKLSFKEEAPANKTGVNVVGTGDDPTVWKRKKKKVKTEQFGGNKVFIVSGQRFHDSRLGKARYARYEKYVGNDDVGEAIRLYGRTNPKLPIILKNSENGAMLYLKYGNKR